MRVIIVYEISGVSGGAQSFNMKHSYKHVVITGASSGIGQALAEYFAENSAGEPVMLSLSGQNQARLEAVVRRCQDLGAEAHGEIVCVTDRAAMEAWLFARDDVRTVDLVVANAGISGGTAGTCGAESLEQIDRIMAVNVDGVLNSVHPLLPRMVARGADGQCGGQVAIMASLAGFLGWPGAPAYCASKAAVRVYGEGLRGALAGSGVRVNVVCPGFVSSRMTDVNEFAMPFKIEARMAADIIARGILKDRGRISFPWRAVVLMWGLMSLPNVFSEILLRRTPRKCNNI